MHVWLFWRPLDSFVDYAQVAHTHPSTCTVPRTHTSREADWLHTRSEAHVRKRFHTHTFVWLHRHTCSYTVPHTHMFMKQSHAHTQARRRTIRHADTQWRLPIGVYASVRTWWNKRTVLHASNTPSMLQHIQMSMLQHIQMHSRIKTSADFALSFSQFLSFCLVCWIVWREAISTALNKSISILNLAPANMFCCTAMECRPEFLHVLGSASLSLSPSPSCLVCTGVKKINF